MVHALTTKNKCFCFSWTLNDRSVFTSSWSKFLLRSLKNIYSDIFLWKICRMSKKIDGWVFFISNFYVWDGKEDFLALNRQKLPSAGYQLSLHFTCKTCRSFRIPLHICYIHIYYTYINLLLEILGGGKIKHGCFICFFRCLLHISVTNMQIIIKKTYFLEKQGHLLETPPNL